MLTVLPLRSNYDLTSKIPPAFHRRLKIVFVNWPDTVSTKWVFCSLRQNASAARTETDKMPWTGYTCLLNRRLNNVQYVVKPNQPRQASCEDWPKKRIKAVPNSLENTAQDPTTKPCPGVPATFSYNSHWRLIGKSIR